MITFGDSWPRRVLSTSGRGADCVQRVRRGAPTRNVSLRAQVLCSERHWNEALELVQPPSVCHPQVLRHLAVHLGTCS